MTLPVRLLGLLLTAVGLVVATTGLVLLIQPVVDLPAAMEAPGETDAETSAPARDAASPGQAVSPSPTPGPTMAPSPRPSGPSPTDRSAVMGESVLRPAEDRTRDQASPSPTVSPTTPQAPPASPTSTSPTVQPVQPGTTSPTAQPAPTTASPTPVSTASREQDPKATGEDRTDRRDGRGTACRDEAWPWGPRRGSRGQGEGWGPPTRCNR